MKLASCMLWPFSFPEGVEATAFNHALYSSKLLLKTGFDACELNAQLVHGLSDEETALLAAEGFPIVAANCFIPGDLPIYGFGKKLESYVERTLRHLGMLGASYVIFGSGGARQRPEGVSEEAHKKELIRFLRMCNGYSEKYGVDVVIEPLNSKECNVLTSVSEAYALVKELHAPHVKLLADAYHVYEENEPLDSLAIAKDALVHVHVAEPKTRAYPGKDRHPFLRGFMKKLHEIGYEGSVSVEFIGMEKIEEETAAMHAYMRELV